MKKTLVILMSLAIYASGGTEVSDLDQLRGRYLRADHAETMYAQRGVRGPSEVSKQTKDRLRDYLRVVLANAELNRPVDIRDLTDVVYYVEENHIDLATLGYDSVRSHRAAVVAIKGYLNANVLKGLDEGDAVSFEELVDALDAWNLKPSEFGLSDEQFKKFHDGAYPNS